MVYPGVHHVKTQSQFCQPKISLSLSILARITLSLPPSGSLTTSQPPSKAQHSTPSVAVAHLLRQECLSITSSAHFLRTFSGTLSLSTMSQSLVEPLL